MNDYINQAFKSYIANPCFSVSQNLHPGNPFLRPIAPLLNQPSMNFEQAINSSQHFSHQLLFNIYEHDMIFLPPASEDGWSKFNQFYNIDTCTQAETLRPHIELALFSDLPEKIGLDLDKTGYSIDQMLSLFEAEIRKSTESESALLSTITASDNQKRALHNFLAQCAGDFLTEASGMARNLPGNFGPEQSELFKVFIDEFGYGVHDKKHSQLYEALLADQGLDNTLHAYWQYYLPSSLALHNYIHLICKNHRYFFRYLGGLYYAEATYSDFCCKISKVIKAVTGPYKDTRYFDEHYHIDKHHRSMVIDKIIMPLLGRYGEIICKPIVQGFLEFKYFLNSNEQEMITQTRFINELEIRPSPRTNNTSQDTQLEVDQNWRTNYSQEKHTITASVNSVQLCFGIDAQLMLHEGQQLSIDPNIFYSISATKKPAVITKACLK